MLLGRDLHFAVLVSANAEWQPVREANPRSRIVASPYGEYFFAQAGSETVLFFHGGWGKTAAAGSTQFVIDRFKPRYLINLGTCAGVEGRLRRFEVVAVERAVIYDIREAMGDSQEALDFYASTLSLPARMPTSAIRATIYSADRDLTPEGLRDMEARYHPVAVDWESGSIAWVARRNKIPLLILRGASDLVSLERGEAQGNIALFQENAARVMRGLLGDLPKWIAALRARGARTRE